MYQGSCLCGGVKYKIEAEIESACNCHCTMCQKHHGAAFASYANVRTDKFSFLTGADFISTFESSPGVKRSFCKHCGSSLTWSSEDKFSNYISVALGTLDTEYKKSITKNIHTNNQVCWLANG